MEKQTLTVEETAKYLGLGRVSAFRAIQRGEIPCIRIGRRILVSKPALDKMLETASREKK